MIPHEYASRFEAVLAPFVRSGGLAGAVVAAASSDGEYAAASVGWADIAAAEPMRADTLFWIASQTKPVTATALMMLAEEGRVRLDDPAEDYLPVLQDPWVVEDQNEAGLRLRKADRKMTVRDLLRHTSGMPFRTGVEEPAIDRLALSGAVKSYAMGPLLFQPGTRYGYSNCGINAVGQIIEVASGMSYAAFVQERLLDPLGMADTTFVPSAAQVRRLAKSYKPNAAGDGLEEAPISFLSYPLDDPARQPVPAGGLFSTAADVVRFCRMILSGGRAGSKTYLSEASVAEMTCRQTPDAWTDSYGLGWDVGPDSYGHAGAQGTQMRVDPGRGLITVYLVQHDGYLFDGGKAYEAFAAAAQS